MCVCTVHAGGEDSDPVSPEWLASGQPALRAHPPPRPGGQSSKEPEVHWKQTSHCHLQVGTRPLVYSSGEYIVVWEIQL